MQAREQQRPLADEILLVAAAVLCAGLATLAGCELAELVYVLHYGVHP